jgi:hypothetical protein
MNLANLNLIKTLSSVMSSYDFHFVHSKCDFLPSLDDGRKVGRAKM